MVATQVTTDTQPRPLYDSQLRRPRGKRPILSTQQISSLPKAVLHAHLDGSCPRQLYDQTVERLMTHGILPDNAALDPRWDGQGGLTGFLEAYARVQQVLAHVPRPQLFGAIMQRARQQGVVYVEMLASLRSLRPDWPQLAYSGVQHHQDKQTIDPLELARSTAPTLAEMQDAARRYRVHAGMLCALGPQYGQEHMRSVLQAAKILHNQGLPVVGVGISGEYYQFEPIHRLLKQEGLDGLLYVPHAGELPREPCLRQALADDPPLPSRIAHGIEAQIHPDLIQRLKQYNICCDVAPTSNEMLGACSPGRHPIVDLIRAGVPCTINPDDELLLGNDICAEYELVQAMGATPSELVNAARQSIIFSGADHRLRRRWLADIDVWESQNIAQVSMIELLHQSADANGYIESSTECGFPYTIRGEPCKHPVRPGQRCPDHRTE